MVSIRKRLSNERGAAAVEFALISTILFMIVFGIIEFGQFYGKYNVLQGAAREGARYAAVRNPVTNTGPTTSQVATRISSGASPYGWQSSTLSISPTCSSSTSGSPITVQWSEPFDISMPFLPPIDQTVVIKGVFRCE